MLGNVHDPETILKISIGNRITHELKKALKDEKAYFQYLEDMEKSDKFPEETEQVTSGRFRIP